MQHPKGACCSLHEGRGQKYMLNVEQKLLNSADKFTFFPWLQGSVISLLLFYKCFSLCVCQFLYLSVERPITLTLTDSFCLFLFHLLDLTPLPLCAFFLSLCGGPLAFHALFVFRCRWFVAQPCFSRACVQKQCVRGWAWFCSLISRSKAKGWVITACMPPSVRTEGG